MLDFEFIRDNWFFITMGIGATLGVVIFSFLLATPLAVMVAAGRRSTSWFIKAVSTLYTLLIDGIPLLLLIFFFFLALPQLGIVLPGFWAGVLVLTINYSSRMSEIFYMRPLDSKERQTESWLPLLPPLAREFTSMIKDSTLVAITGFVHEVMWRAIKVGRAEFKNLEALLIATLIYLIIITFIVLGVKVLNFIITNSRSSTVSFT